MKNILKLQRRELKMKAYRIYHIEEEYVPSDYIDEDNRDFVNLMKQYYIQK